MPLEEGSPDAIALELSRELFVLKKTREDMQQASREEDKDRGRDVFRTFELRGTRLTRHNRIREIGARIGVIERALTAWAHGDDPLVELLRDERLDKDSAEFRLVEILDFDVNSFYQHVAPSVSKTFMASKLMQGKLAANDDTLEGGT